MAVAFIQEFSPAGDDRRTENYDAIMQELDLPSNAPSGLLVHTAGWDEASGVFRIFQVWEDEQRAEAFMNERLRPLLSRPVDPDNLGDVHHQGYYELHDLVQP